MKIQQEELTEVLVSNAKTVLLPAFGRTQATYKSDGSIVTDADLQMSERIQKSLQNKWPDIGFLSEEMTSMEQKAQINDQARPFWILDPLDGTTNFAAGIPFFAVSLALYENGAIRLGIIYDPVRDEVFYAEQDAGTQLNGVRLQTKSDKMTLSQCVGIIDLKRLAKPLAKKLSEKPPYASQRSFGSVALDWCWLAIGRGQIYLHGKQKVWDYAAGQLILSEAGGMSCTLESESVFTTLMQPRSAVAASSSELFEQWRLWLDICG